MGSFSLHRAARDAIDKCRLKASADRGYDSGAGLPNVVTVRKSTIKHVFGTLKRSMGAIKGGYRLTVDFQSVEKSGRLQGTGLVARLKLT